MFIINYFNHYGTLISSTISSIYCGGGAVSLLTIKAIKKLKNIPKVPIPSGLVSGEDYYCNYRPLPTPCASQKDWDERCEFEHRTIPSHF